MGQTESRELKNHEVTDDTARLKNVTTLEGVIPLNQELGRGAYGRVFTVKYGKVIYAAKEIHSCLIDYAGYEGKQSRMKDDFIRKCLCCNSIQHPNVVKFIGIYYRTRRSKFPIMVMELMHTNLTNFVVSKKSNISFPKKISILHDVSLGLTFLHNHKPQILHRDLSPNNIMLTTEPLVAKIGDLGVAKVVRAGSKETISKLKLSQACPGTIDFMPPEALGANSHYGSPIDVFSFGGIALYVLSEEWPNPISPKQKDVNTKEMITLSEVQRRQQYMDRINGADIIFKKMVEQCLSDDPDNRPKMQEVSDEIKDLKIEELLEYNNFYLSYESIAALKSEIQFFDTHIKELKVTLKLFKDIVPEVIRYIQDIKDCCDKFTKLRIGATIASTAGATVLMVGGILAMPLTLGASLQFAAIASYTTVQLTDVAVYGSHYRALSSISNDGNRKQLDIVKSQCVKVLDQCKKLEECCCEIGHILASNNVSLLAATNEVKFNLGWKVMSSLRAPLHVERVVHIKETAAETQVRALGITMKNAIKHKMIDGHIFNQKIMHPGFLKDQLATFRNMQDNITRFLESL